MTRKILQQALEALDGGHVDRTYGYIQDLLEQPVQPEVCCGEYHKCHKPCTPRGRHYGEKLATKREWVGLTKTQIKLLWEGVQAEAIHSGQSSNWVFYTYINEALKERNT